MSCASFLNVLPPTVILALVIWSYYSYVFQFCIFLLDNVVKKSLYLFFYHVFLIMFMWSFLQTTCKSHDPIPDEYHLAPNEHARLLSYREDEANSILKKLIRVRNLEMYTCGPNGRVRYCKECMLIKPDRTHHCSTCERCILKMDHHCPWVYNCVGFCNYKQFLLILLWGMIWCSFYAATVAEYIVEIWKDFQSNLSKLLLGVGFVVAAFMGMLIAILFFYHLHLVLKNETTIEALRETTFTDDNLTFNLGKWPNFAEVFGEDICCWLLPTKSRRGNGYEFRVNTLIP